MGDGWAPTEGYEPCGYEFTEQGTTWRCVHWKHTGTPHYVRPVDDLPGRVTGPAEGDVTE